MIRIVVTGSECTGKTTLAQTLAQHYQVEWVPEFARLFVATLGRAPAVADVETIARGQIELERRALREGGRLVIQDTDLLSTIVYSHHYYDECPVWIEQELGSRPADLYLLAHIDVPWVADGEQRDRGERREEMQALFREALVDRKLRYLEIRGSRSERLAVAVRAIDRWLGNSGSE